MWILLLSVYCGQLLEHDICLVVLEVEMEMEHRRTLDALVAFKNTPLMRSMDDNETRSLVAGPEPLSYVCALWMTLSK